MAVGHRATTAALVHLRRPSQLSTLTCPTRSRSTTRPAATPSATTATCATTGRCARRIATQGRIHGRADTEVGARWLEDAWRPEEPVGHLLGALHDRFGGQANLAVLTADGTPHHYAGNGENPVFTFRLGRRSASSRPGSTRSIARCSGSSHRPRRSVGWSRCTRRSGWTVTARRQARCRVHDDGGSHATARRTDPMTDEPRELPPPPDEPGAGRRRRPSSSRPSSSSACRSTGSGWSGSSSGST